MKRARFENGVAVLVNDYAEALNMVEEMHKKFPHSHETYNEMKNFLVKEIEQKIGGKGRVLLRKSGTEPVVRVMVECESENNCREYAQYISKKIKEVAS